ncbi:hypothetical protein SAMN05421825_0551 [Epilithonimonas hungarica]|uniref:Uncharacterized protein n=1 Tax=Epilithonimonas hungarica TaxID=454006 RepID=A0A1G7GR73_9FLAO|nr:hypothetical protein SAMN05421825_0551 [Epilithonimonas hungarica]
MNIIKSLIKIIIFQSKYGNMKSSSEKYFAPLIQIIYKLVTSFKA